MSRAARGRSMGRPWKRRLWSAALHLALLATPLRADVRPPLEVVPGVTPEGEATGQWLTMLRKRLTAEEYSRIEGVKKQLSDAERAWAELIRSRVGIWEGRRAGLAAPFQPLAPPEGVVIVLGNRGGDDAFTHDPRTIGFDLSILQSAYGDAVAPVNLDRIDRFFDHEYSHLLQKDWLAGHPYPAESPQRAALLDIWLEGLGNYRSLSERWRPVDGRPSKAESEARRALEPRFAARMSALACAGPEEAALLMKDLSEGRFDAKWGALPAALWLAAEAGRDPDALRRFVQEGPDAVWGLAERHMPDLLKAVLSEARLAASTCGSGTR